MVTLRCVHLHTGLANCSTAWPILGNGLDFPSEGYTDTLIELGRKYCMYLNLISQSSRGAYVFCLCSRPYLQADLRWLGGGHGQQRRIDQ